MIGLIGGNGWRDKIVKLSNCQIAN